MRITEADVLVGHGKFDVRRHFDFSVSGLGFGLGGWIPELATV